MLKPPHVWPSAAHAASIIVLVAALLPGASPADAARPPDLRVTSLSKPPRALLAGHRLKLRVKVANRRGRAGRSRVGLFLSTNAQWSSSDVELTGSRRTRALRGRRSAAVRVRVRVPRNAPPGVRFRLLACADARHTVAEANEGNNCRAGRAVVVVGGSAFQVIDAYASLGRLSASKALLYKLYALSGDRRLPRRFRGDGSRLSGTNILRTALERRRSLPARVRAQVERFLRPPIYPQSFASRAQADGGADLIDPNSFDACSARGPGWDNVLVSSGGQGIARVWWRTSSRDQANADRLAGALVREIWPRLTGLMGRTPVPDGRMKCGGVDPLLDVYLYPTGNPDYAFTPQWFECEHWPSPGFIVVDPRASRATLAHEFMHLLHASFPFAVKSCRPWYYVNDATATWAEDFVYHGDQSEDGYTGLVEKRSAIFGYPLDWGYDGWAFMFSATHHQGPARVRAIYELARTIARPLDAVDAALQGGFDTSWPRFAREAWNRPLLPNGLKESFFSRSWDSWGPSPFVRPIAYRLRGRQFTDPLPIELAGMSKQYYDLRFDNRNAREVTFQNPSGGTRSKLRTWAFVKIAREGWKLEDWTQRKEVEFCRDDKTEDVRQVVLVQSSWKRPSAAKPYAVLTASRKPKLRLRDRCDAKVVLHIHGSESLTVTDSECGVQERYSSPSWRADIEFDIRSRFGTRTDQSEMVRGSGSGNRTGVVNICHEPEPYSTQWELGPGGTSTGSLEVKPSGGGARVTLVLTPFFNQIGGEGDWSPYFVFDLSLGDWCEGPHGFVSARQLKARHISIPMSASCERTAVASGSGDTFHGIASASGTLEVRR